MKDKKIFTYILLAGSLLVWGLVIYKVFSFVGGSDDAVEIHAVAEKISHTIEKEESYELLVSYRDPFLNRIDMRGEEYGSSIKKARRTNVVKEPEKPLDLSFISYSGMITNPATKRKVALVAINGKQMMVAEGEIMNEIHFMKNYKDSIQILYQGRKACIKRF